MQQTRKAHNDYRASGEAMKTGHKSIGVDFGGATQARTPQ